jgi:hypothetical protein
MLKIPPLSPFKLSNYRPTKSSMLRSWQYMDYSWTGYLKIEFNPNRNKESGGRRLKVLNIQAGHVAAGRLS